MNCHINRLDQCQPLCRANRQWKLQIKWPDSWFWSIGNDNMKHGSNWTPLNVLVLVAQYLKGFGAKEERRKVLQSHSSLEGSRTIILRLCLYIESCLRLQIQIIERQGVYLMSTMFCSLKTMTRITIHLLGTTVNSILPSFRTQQSWTDPVHAHASLALDSIVVTRIWESHQVALLFM